MNMTRVSFWRSLCMLGLLSIGLSTVATAAESAGDVALPCGSHRQRHQDGEKTHHGMIDRPWGNYVERRAVPQQT